MNQSVKPQSLLQLIDRKKFDELCAQCQMDKGVRSFSTWDQTRALVLSYVMRLQSLREVESILSVPKSTFSDANQIRPSGFFEDLCKIILEQIRIKTHSRKVRKAIKSLLVLDSTECAVHGNISRYPFWRQRKASAKEGSVKLHALCHIICRDPETKKVFDFITSDFQTPAENIAAI